MKTKKLLFLIVSIVFAINVYGIEDTLHINTLTSPPTVDLRTYCIDGDSMVIIATVAGTFTAPGEVFSNVNKVKISKSSLVEHNGNWTFGTGDVTNNRSWNMFFVSPMVSYWNGMLLNYCGQPTMVLTPQPDSAKANIVWTSPTPSTDASITVPQSTTDIWYIVKATNACNTVWDSIHIIPNPNVPNLGMDDSVCADVIHTLDAGSGYDYYIWSTGETTQTILVDSNGTYKVSVTDLMGCVLTDQINVTFFQPTSEEICYVEFDTASWKNNIVLPPAPANADSIRIYKEMSLGVWVFMGNAPKTTTNFVDVNSAPQNQSYSYKATVVDTCGNESDSSSFHTTITLLSTYDEGTNTYGFTWSPYYGLTVSDYKLYGIFPNNTIVLLGTVPGNQFFFNLVNPNPAFVKFFIGFDAPACGAKTNVLVKSNWVSSTTGIKEAEVIQFSIHPNPVSSTISITTDEKDFEIQISNVFGQVLLSEENAKTLDITNFSSGIYFISIITEKSVSTQRIQKL
jgi:hypothetical protein